MEILTSKSMDPLDLQYIQILHVIKPYITCIMNNQYIELIKLWLEKLSGEGMKDKSIRNSYLIQLGKQIEEGVLDEPFTAPPPDHQLEARHDEKVTRSYSRLKKSGKLPRNKKRKLKRTVCIKPESIFNEFEITNYDNYKEDSSWMDLTDDNLSAAGDAGNNPKDDNQINYLMNVIEELKSENLVLKQSNHDEQIGRFNWQNNVNQLQQKLATVQKRNAELKSVIKQMERKLAEAQCVYNNNPRKCVLLSEMHKKEVELLCRKHQQEIEQMKAQHSEETENDRAENVEKYKNACCWYEDRIGEMRLEIEKGLHEYYEKEIEETKNYYEENCKSREERDEKLEMDRRKQIEECKLDCERRIQMKNEEVERLERLLGEQCMRMQKEVNEIRNHIQNDSDGDADEKIAFLQKCVLKMEKMYGRAEREFCKQVLKLHREMEMRDKHTQILISTQRVKLISNNSFMKQKEIDNIVTKLEEQYKAMLLMHQNEIMKEKRNDQQTIAELREQLSTLKC